MKSLSFPKQLRLLFRASGNSFSAAHFHKKCDKFKNTLILLRTEFGRILGGFTEYPWDSVKKGFFNHRGKNAFLFSLDHKEILVPNDRNHLIYCDPNCGPVFGSEQHDLYI